MLVPRLVFLSPALSGDLIFGRPLLSRPAASSQARHHVAARLRVITRGRTRTPASPRGTRGVELVIRACHRAMLFLRLFSSLLTEMKISLGLALSLFSSLFPFLSFFICDISSNLLPLCPALARPPLGSSVPVSAHEKMWHVCCTRPLALLLSFSFSYL